jgi:hypothetical protein
VFLLFAMLVVIGCRLVLHGPRAFRLRTADLGVSAALLVPAALALWPYRAVQQEMGLRRSLEDWSVPWASFLASSSHADTWLLSLVPSWRINDVMGPHLFPGVLPIALAAAAFLAGRAKGRGQRAGQGGRRIVAGLLELAAVGALAVGVYVALTDARRIKIGEVTVMTIRQPWRAWIVAVLAIAVRVAIAPRVPQLLVWLGAARDHLSGWRVAHRDDPRVAYSAVTALSLWLAVGLPIGLWPIVYWLPGLNFIRAPSRFTLLTVLGLAVLAGMGFERLVSGLTPRGRRMAALAAGVLLVAEFAAVPFELEPYRVEVPAIDRWLADQPMPFVVAEVPVGNSRNFGQWERREATFMLHSTAHWQKTVHGYSGFRSEQTRALLAELAEFPSEQGLQHLSALGVTDLVVHTDLFPPGDWPVVEQRIAGFAGWLTLRHVEGDGRVYAIRGPR